MIDQTYKAITDDLMKLTISKLLDSLLRDKKEKIPMNDYIKSYKIVTNINAEQQKNSKIEYSVELFKFFVAEIQSFVNELYERVKLLQGEEILDTFKIVTEKMVIFIAWISKITASLMRHTGNTKTENLLQHTLAIYKETLILPIKNNLYKAMNDLINLDRNCNVVDREKIKFDITDKIS